MACRDCGGGGGVLLLSWLWSVIVIVVVDVVVVVAAAFVIVHTLSCMYPHHCRYGFTRNYRLVWPKSTRMQWQGSKVVTAHLNTPRSPHHRSSLNYHSTAASITAHHLISQHPRSPHFLLPLPLTHTVSNSPSTPSLGLYPTFLMSWNNYALY